jgi:regulator of cell morphogenesis and NO signaling
MSSSPIHSGLQVNEVIQQYPETVAVFNEWGIDSCCGGARPLAEVAERHGFDLEKLLGDLQGAVDTIAPPAA